tara:strand:- start:1429 stop:3186 length:1758 start_codon:yes stop_codon:yes gene_type:complete
MVDTLTYKGTLYNFNKELDKIKKQIDIFTSNLEGTASKSDLESHAKNVCRIHAHTRNFDWKQPANKNNGSSGTGTGFVLKEMQPSDEDSILIVTAHHVIANAIQIRVKFNKLSSEDVTAKIIGCNPVMDVALLSITDKSIKEKLNGFDIGMSDEIGPLEEVRAMGFALGKEHLQTTQGVISGRISRPSRLQTTVDVNPGNSGGPLLNSDNKVLGIITSGLTNANGIYYAAPIFEAKIMFDRMLKSSNYIEPPLTAEGAVLDYIPSLNSSFTKSNKVLLENLPTDGVFENGICCTAVHDKIEYPSNIEQAKNNLKTYSDHTTIRCLKFLDTLTHSVIDEMTKCDWKQVLLQQFNLSECSQLMKKLRNPTLKKGDLVSSIIVNRKSYEIDSHMNCQFDFWPDRLPYISILDRLSIGDKIVFKVGRLENKKYKTIDVEIALNKCMDAFREMFADTELVPFLSLAGVVVMPLLHNHIPLFKNNSMLSMMDTPTAPHKSQLLITHILPESPFNKSESVSSGDIIVAINNKKVDTLKRLSRIWQKLMDEKKPITLNMRDGSLTTATTESIVSSQEKIIQEYKSKEYIKTSI